MTVANAGAPATTNAPATGELVSVFTETTPSSHDALLVQG